jgi:hypothetical protein
VAETLTLTLATLTPPLPPTGSAGDTLRRLRGLMPSSWFPRAGLYGTQNGPLLLAGTSTGRMPQALNVSLDGGTTFQPVTTFTPGNPWMATAPTLPPGNYSVKVQDAAFPALKSNAIPVAVLLPSAAATVTVLQILLTGPGTALAAAYTLIAYVKAQMRLATSIGGMIDLWAYDFFGYWLRRRPSEQDGPFIARIMQNLFAPLVTRAGMVSALTNLLGVAPTIFEPFSVLDAGAYSNKHTAYGVSRYGSRLMPAQCFITVNRPAIIVPGQIPAYGAPNTAYGAPTAYYFPAAGLAGVVQDSEILATINRTKAAGVICWVNIQG